MTQPDIWARLAEPFPPSEVKQRQGPGGRMLSYVDARAVAQRLDDVLTPAGWEFICSVIPGSDVVKGRLTINVERGGGIGGVFEISREDHGYPNSDRDEEPIKAATSDALKRCAVLFGVGRHLYDDNHQHSPQRGVGFSSPAPRTNNGSVGNDTGPVVAAAGRTSPRPAAPTTPPTLEEPEWFKDGPQPAQNGSGAAVAGTDERMTTRELLNAAEAQGIPTRDVGAKAKQLYGISMVKDLDDQQRAVVWQELAR